MWSGNKDGYDNSEMLMPRLCADNSLTDCIFSVYLSPEEGGTSYVDFGKPDSSIVKDPSKTAWMDINKGNDWSSTVNGFRWGPEWTKKDNNEYKIPKAPASIDTGTTCITGPDSSVLYILANILYSLE